MSVGPQGVYWGGLGIVQVVMVDREHGGPTAEVEVGP